MLMRERTMLFVSTVARGDALHDFGSFYVLFNQSTTGQRCVMPFSFEFFEENDLDVLQRMSLVGNETARCTSIDFILSRCISTSLFNELISAEDCSLLLECHARVLC